MFARAIDAPRVLLGCGLCCCFFVAQTHVQNRRLLRAETLSPSVKLCETGQPQSRTDHLGSSTTRALKPSPTLVLLASLGDLEAPPICRTFVEPPGLRAEPLLERAAKRPLLRI